MDPGYWTISRRPLQILVFLLPLIVAYEFGLAWLLRSEQGVLTNKAHESLLVVLDLLGVTAASGLYLGGIVILVVLFIWHLLNRDPWQISWETVGMMAVESLVMTLPLIALGLLIQRSLPAASLGAESGTIELARLTLWPKMAISVGAGLYEELVFRMMLIAILHTLLVDLLHLRHSVGLAIAIAISAIAFTWYHPLRTPQGAVSLARILFYFLAGLYFGVLYVVRGFGIVVGVHALYDVVTVGLLSDPAE